MAVSSGFHQIQIAMTTTNHFWACEAAAHLEGGDVDGLGVPAKLLTDQVVGQQLPFDPLGVGLRPVTLVDGDDHWN